MISYSNSPGDSASYTPKIRSQKRGTPITLPLHQSCWLKYRKKKKLKFQQLDCYQTMYHQCECESCEQYPIFQITHFEIQQVLGTNRNDITLVIMKNT